VRRFVVAAGILGSLWGCGPVNSAIALRDAREALDMARQAEAPDVAPYEWTMAKAYLDKAREEQGYADYKMSVELAERTAELAQFAVDAVGGYRPTEGGGTGQDDPIEELGPPPEPSSESDAPSPEDPGLGPAAGTDNGPPPPSGNTVGPVESAPEPEAAPAPTVQEAPPGVTVYTDPATGTQYYIDSNTGEVVYLSGAAQ